MSNRIVFTVGLGGIARSEIEPCRPDALADVAAALAHVFLRRRRGSSGDIRRMRDLVSMLGPQAIVREAGFASGNPRQVEQRATWPSALLGAHVVGSWSCLGIGLPFGRITAGDLAAIAAEAEKHGGQELRLTPWRTILLPLPSISAASVLSAKLPRERFILNPDDARLRVAACPGAPSCSQATTKVRDDAAILAVAMQGLQGSGAFLHVSGCDKGCAHPRPAAVTLVAKAGYYNLVRNGVASDAASCSDLTVDQAAEQIRQITGRQPQHGAA